MKNFFYILCAIFLGVLLATIAHALVEIWHIRKFLAQGLVPQISAFFGFRCFLPLYAQVIFLFSGVIGGYLLGQNWWRIVYVEYRHCRYNKNKKL